MVVISIEQEIQTVETCMMRSRSLNKSSNE